MKTTLTHSQNFFLLKNTPENIGKKLYSEKYWQKLSPTEYKTKSIRAAASFRKFADERVERIFKKLFQEFYEVPSWRSEIPYEKLDKHQRDGVRWVLSRKRSYLAHAPGAGKTCTTIIASLYSEGKGQILFIVPPSLVKNWEREILKFSEWTSFFPTIGVVKTSEKKLEVGWRADILIVPDSMITKDWVYEELLKIKFKFIAVDEASRFKDPLAERSLAFYGGATKEKQYRGLYKEARHVVFLDGSPMPNRPIELWAPTFALSPESIDLMSYDEFGLRYCGAKPNALGQWEYLYSSNELELKEKLQKDFMHVVSEHELSHPERLRRIIPTNKDLRTEEQRRWEEGLKVTSFSESISKGEIARFRRELGLSKVPFVVKFVKERLEKNEAILLFAWHREVAMTLCEKLIKYKPLVVIGGVSHSDRDKHFEAFQSGRTSLLIVNIQAGGRGNNLQRADRIIFAEPSWSDELNRQCEKRASRRDSKKFFVPCDYIVSPGSIDELVLRSIQSKERRVKKVIGG